MNYLVPKFMSQIMLNEIGYLKHALSDYGSVDIIFSQVINYADYLGRSIKSDNH